MAKSDGGTDRQFKSALKGQAERFLSQTVVYVLEEGFRTPDDFLRHFKPLDLMQGLEAAPDLRAKLLVESAGVHEKIARKKSTPSAAEDLRIALEEGVTNPAQVVALLPPDDRVRYLDPARLWTFATEDEFWSPQRSADGNADRALGRTLFLIENALGENLITLAGVADGISFETISTRLPLKELQKVVRASLKLGRERKPFDESALLNEVPLRALLGYLPLELVYGSVIVERVAKPAGFLKSSPPASEGWESPASSRREAPADAKNDAPRSKSVPPPKPSPSPAPPPPLVKLEEVPQRPELPSVTDEDIDALISQSQQRPAAEEEARKKVVEKLAAINRLPPRHDTLSTQILLSIESMYSELLGASTDEAREMAIRDAFPNQSQLTQALLALIELLDPSIDINDPVIKEADLDSLIKVVLFEERHRYEQQHPSARPSSPNGPAGGARKSVAPPPLPGGKSAVPPPLPDQKRAR